MNPAQRPYTFLLGMLMLVCCPALIQAQHCVEWTLAAESGPVPRRTFGMVYDTVVQRTVLFGGADMNYARYDDTWVWDARGWTQVASGGPAPRSSFGMAYDDRRARVVVFGGAGLSSARFGDTWEWDGQSWEQVADEFSVGPGRRYSVAMTFDEARGVTVLYGGSGPSGDTWLWDGESWVQVVVEGPPARSQACLTYDRARQQCLLFGGFDEDWGWMDETWSWDGSQWRLLSDSAPGMGISGALTYDDIRQAPIYFGGYVNNLSVGDAWAWNGYEWQLISETGQGPLQREFSSLVYDQARECVVLFGGSTRPGQILHGDTWLMKGPLRLIRNPESQILRLGQPAVFSVETRGQTPRGYRWRRDGRDLIDGGNIRGATTDTLTIRHVWPLDAGRYDVVISADCGDLASGAAQLVVRDTRLTADATCPQGGPLRVHWFDASSAGDVALLFSDAQGFRLIPPGMPCTGLPLGLNQSARIVWRGVSNADGSRTLDVSASPQACGGSIQIVDVDYCVTSNTAVIR